MMKRIVYTYYFKVNFKDRHDEFWLREDIEGISSSIEYDFKEDSKIMRISDSRLYASEITIILDYYNLEYVRLFDFDNEIQDDCLYPKLLQL